MGKIRIKTFDESSPEDEAKLKAKKEAKRAEKIAAKNEQKQALGKKTNPQTDGSIPVVEAVETVTTPEDIVETTVKTVEETVVTEEETKPAKKTKKDKFAKAKKKTDSK